MSEDEYVGELDWDKINIPSAESEGDLLLETDMPTNDTNANSASVESGDLPHAVQIVSIGSESDAYAFTFHEDSLNHVLNKIEPSMKVCIISVVGAFRTGKSFLLSWFLRYLHYHSQVLGSSDSFQDKTDSVKKNNENVMWYEKVKRLGNDGFDWRGGSERNTTGIWMWSHPFILPRASNQSENIAVLLVDTQGMFDNETTMSLTASIFGLSTLLSSFQIYNVQNRIQEDNLQHLALFSEYGRMALNTEESRQEHVEKQAISSSPDILEKDSEVKPLDNSSKKAIIHKPFQRIEFLVRDWQHFEDDQNLESCILEMNNYLSTVLAERDAADLKDTRDQITSCFEFISCFMFTHPGFSVTRKKYTGDVAEMDPTFLAFLDRYCQRVFGCGHISSGEPRSGHTNNLVPKAINGRELTAAELGAYIKSYANLFANGATHFPEASTLLEATSAANNSNATNLSIQHYKQKMDAIAGIRCSDYVSPDDLETFHQTFFKESMDIFAEIANFGSRKAIDNSKNTVEKAMQENFDLYSQLNDSRNPLLGIGIYIIPMAVGFLSALLRWIADWTCSSWSQTCQASSEILSHVYQVVFFFMVIVAFTKAKQLSSLFNRMKKAFDVMMMGDNAKSSK